MSTDTITDTTSEFVSKFYGQEVQKTEDLIFDACCVADYDLSLLTPITNEVKERRYGCGSPLPELLNGLTVLDLGSGAGIDVFIAAQLVGPQGRVIGVDMTDEQLDIARRNVDPIMKNIGYEKSNVEFLKGRIEEIPVESGTVDVVISNCVINLSENKEAVFKEIWRVLKPGGWICARTVNKWGYVAMVSRLVPNALHARLLGRIQPQRSEADVFPTVYRLNTPAAARRHFRGHEVIWYHDNGDPSYHFGNGLLYRLLLLGHRLLPARLATSICFFVRKSSRA